MLLTEPDGDLLLVSWALNSWRPEGIMGIATPQGLFSKEALRQETTAAIAPRFFTWYGESKDAQYHRGMALNLLWNGLLWIEPYDERESAVIREACAHLARARELAPDLRLPLAAWREAAALVGLPADDITGPDLDPDQAVGYRRGDIVHRLGPWEITLPGWFRHKPDDRTLVYGGDGRTVRVAALGMRDPNQLYSPPPLPGKPLLKEEQGAFTYTATFCTTLGMGPGICRDTS